MNKVILMGRLTGNPDVRQGDKMFARYTLAVDRYGEGSDFIPCVAFGKTAEFADKYLMQGMKILITGHIQTGNYTNREGKKVYTTDVVIESQEFTEKKKDEFVEADEAPFM